MRRISAHYIFPVCSPPLRNGIITLDDEGKIAGISENNDGKEQSGVEFYNGVLVPGFVNCHVHLELSHLKNKLDKKKGISHFVSQIRLMRNDADTDEILSAMALADLEMYKNGIKLAGDITNNSSSFIVKKKSKLLYHNFIEVFGSFNKNIDVLDNANRIYELFRLNNSHVSITPHSFYSLNEDLFNRTVEASIKTNSILSIHNQESADEQELFSNKSGKLHSLLNNSTNSAFLWDNLKEPLTYLIKQINQVNPLLLIHNTYTTSADIDTMSDFSNKTFWIFCPSSNLYIENRLPDINLFRNKRQIIALGTDSLASNDTLDILKEIILVQNNYPDIKFEEIITWATYNGAKALNMENKFGAFEHGKQPGINLINKFDFANFKPSKESTITVII